MPEVITDEVVLQSMTDDGILDYVMDLLTNSQASFLEKELAERLERKLGAIKDMEGDERRLEEAEEEIESLKNDLRQAEDEIRSLQERIEELE